MRTSFDHLPHAKQRELARALDILHAEFADAMKHASSAKKKDGRIVRIVLFGSYARDTWVDEPHTAKGYQSDFDLLVVVNQARLTDFADLWYKAEDRMLTDPGIRRQVNFIVHTLDEVNNALAQGQYFFSDIVRDGIVLYELKGTKPFVRSKPLGVKEALEAAQKHYDFWIQSATQFKVTYEFALDKGWNNRAAFDLHQAVERLYTCYLLVRTNYAPSTHNIKFLRSLAEDLDRRMVDVWPREARRDRRAFELLKRAYVEARYSERYSITADELAWLGDRAEALKTAVERLCNERLASLRQGAE